MDTETQLAFVGTLEEQELAARAFEVMKRKGMLFGANAPIKMTAEAVAKALTKAGGPMAGDDPARLAPAVALALEHNPEVFAKSGKDFVTTKAGRAYHTGEAPAESGSHTFKERLNTGATTLNADASREYAETLANRAAERSAFIDTLAELPAPPAPLNTPHLPPQPTRPIEFQTLIPQHLIPQPPPVEEPEEEEEVVQAPAPQRAEPAAAQAVQQAPTAPAPPAPAPTTEPPPQPASTAASAPAPAPAAPVVPVAPQPPVREAPQRVEEAAAAAPAATPPTSAATPAAPAAPAEQPVVEKPEPVPPATKPVEVSKPAPVPASAPASAPASLMPKNIGPVEVEIAAPQGVLTVDINRSIEEILQDEAVAFALEGMLSAAVEKDSRLFRFGSDFFPEDAVERFSKGDFRRIREYLEEEETGGVASDRDIVADVLGRRFDQPDYERGRFSLDYRLLKEKKEFDFVGIDSDRLWIIANSSPAASPARKAAEIGQDYRYLEDTDVQEKAEEQGEVKYGPLDYSLTYYEYENGVLPYDRRFKGVFPGPVFEDQRASLIRFEIPQLYGALIGELRYPTGNRGGFIMGLNELFTEHMVPGAKFQIVPTDRGEDIFEIRFNQIKEREDNLLQLDERRGRYLFRPVSYTVETDPAMLLSEERLGKLHNHKKLDEADRKKPEVIVANAFEAVGEDSDGKLWAPLEDIYPIVNVERPISRSWLKLLLTDTYPFFYPDETTEGAYFYDPSKREA